MSFDQPVVGGEDTSDRAEEDSVSTHESKKGVGRGQDLPRNDHPATDHGSNDAAALDVDKAREQDGQVVRRRDGVGRDVGAHLSDVPAQSCEEGCRPAPGTAI